MTRVQMIVAPFKKGTVIGAGPDFVEVKGDDGRRYRVAPDGLANIKRRRGRRFTRRQLTLDKTTVA